MKLWPVGNMHTMVKGNWKLKSEFIEKQRIFSSILKIIVFWKIYKRVSLSIRKIDELDREFMDEIISDSSSSFDLMNFDNK